MVAAGGIVRDELDRLVPGDRDPGRLIWTSAGAGLFVLQPRISAIGPKAKSAERVATSAFGGQSGLVLLTMS